MRNLTLTTTVGITLLIPTILFAEACPADGGPCSIAPPAQAAKQPAAGAPRKGKTIWANSHMFADAPLPEVQKWMKDKPELDGKFLVIEFWRTWCGACKRMTPRMNALQDKYGDELVVIGITGEDEEAVKNYTGPEKKYYLAYDKPGPRAKKDSNDKAAEDATPEQTPNGPDQSGSQRWHEQGAYEAMFGVYGWPHVVILEPLHRTVVWEGYPGLENYELTEDKVKKMLAIGRAMKAEAAKAAKDKQEN